MLLRSIQIIALLILNSSAISLSQAEPSESYLVEQCINTEIGARYLAREMETCKQALLNSEERHGASSIQAIIVLAKLSSLNRLSGGDLSVSEGYVNDALDRANTSKDPMRMYTALRERYELYMQQAKYINAFEANTLMLHLHERDGKVEEYAEGEYIAALRGRAETLERLDEPTKTMDYSMRAITAARQQFTEKSHFYINEITKHAVLLNNRGLHEEALKLQLSIYQRVVTEYDVLSLTRSGYMRGLFVSLQKNKSNKYEWYLEKEIESLESKNQEIARDELIRLYSLLLDEFIGTDNLAEQIKVIKKVSQLSGLTSIGEGARLYLLFNWHRKNKTPESLHYARQLISYIDRKSASDRSLIMYLPAVAVYLREDNPVEAIELFMKFRKEAVGIPDFMGRKDYFVENDLWLTRIYHSQGMFNEAVRELKNLGRVYGMTALDKVIPGTPLFNHYVRYASLYLLFVSENIIPFDEEANKLTTNLSELLTQYPKYSRHVYQEAFAYSSRILANMREYSMASNLMRLAILAAKENIAINNVPDRAPILTTGYYGQLLSYLTNLKKHKPEDFSLEESFVLGQLIARNAFSKASKHIVERESENNRELGDLLKQKESLAKDRELIFNSPPGQSLDIDLLEKRLNSIDTKIKAVDRQIAASFPKFSPAIEMKDISLKQLQNSLNANEAYLFYVPGHEVTWLWIVKRDYADMITLPVTSMALDALAEQVQALIYNHNSDDPKLYVRLQELHRHLISPATPHLNDVAHLIISVNGPLFDAPFAAFIQSNTPNDLTSRRYDWLINSYSISRSPHPVFQSLPNSKNSRQDNAKKTFIGIGNPILAQDGYYKPLRKAEPPKSGELLNPNFLRQLPSLPESKIELEGLAKLINSNPQDLFLGDRASETNVKSIQLGGYDVLAFATHGVLSEEFGNGIEAGLILTPPNIPSKEDDGYLSASEIAQLELNADLVMLSACNTAGGHTDRSYEGLPGLSASFIYAGARNILVSHWGIDSETAPLITSSMINEAMHDIKIGYAGALRQAMIKLANNTHNEMFTHPFFWAPFSIITSRTAAHNNQSSK